MQAAQTLAHPNRIKKWEGTQTSMLFRHLHGVCPETDSREVPGAKWRIVHQAHIKTKEKLIRELLFADDAALVAHTESAKQRITSCFAEAAQLFGLEVSLKKTEVLHQPAPHEEYHPPSISIEQSELKAVHQFSWLPRVVTPDAKIDKEVDNILANANNAFGRL